MPEAFPSETKVAVAATSPDRALNRGRLTSRLGAALLTGVFLSLMQFPAPAVADSLDDAYSTWTPASFGAYGLAVPTVDQRSKSLPSCAYIKGNRWDGSKGNSVLFLRWRCPDELTAMQAQTLYWTGSNSAKLSTRLGVLPNDADRVLLLHDPTTVYREWVQGPFLLSIVITCTSSEGSCLALSAGLARSVAKLSPYVTGEDPKVAQNQFQKIALTLPLAFWLIFIAPWRFVAFVVRPRRKSVSNSSYRDLSHVVRSQRLLAFGKALLPWVIGWGLVCIPIYAWSGEWLSAVIAATVAGAALIIRLRLPPPLVRLSRHRGDFRSVRGVLGGGLMVLARVLVFLAVLFYVLVGLFGPVVLTASPETVHSAYERLQGEYGGFGPILAAFLMITTVLASGAPGGTYEMLIFFVVLPAMVLAYVTDRLGRGLASSSARRLLAADERPPLLYLRSFDEDRLTMPGIFTRRGIFERLSPIRRRSFEETLVRCLSEFGPVIGISPPGKLLPALGAARLSLSNAEWQDRVQELSSTSLAVVMSATPDMVREGLQFEIDMLGLDPDARVVLVRGPWRPVEVTRRWAAFTAYAREKHLFSPISSMPVEPGAQVFTHRAPEGWSVWGAHTWTDWSYTIAIATAMRDVVGEWALALSRCDIQNQRSITHDVS